MIKNSIAFLKLFCFAFVILSFFIFSAPLFIYCLFSRYEARKPMAYVLKWHTYVSTKIFNMRVTIIDPYESLKTKGLIVGNHLSYLDIIAMSPYMPSCFITSMEMRKTPVLGQIVEAAGCLFVDRRSRKSIGGEIKDITGALKSGLNVTVFPEATSTSGEKVLPFKRSLFKAAIEANVLIKPVTINYRSVDGVELSLSNRDSVCWYGDMEFFPHLWGFLNSSGAEVEINYSKPFSASLIPDLKDLAAQTHSIVAKNYTDIT